VSAEEPVAVEAALPRPGFVLLKLTAREDGGEPYERLAGAGVEPAAIVSGTKDPADFDAFWADRLAKLRARKPAVTESNITAEADRAAASVYDVRIDDGTVAATGILTVPADAQPGRHAAVISFGGASWIGSSPAVKQAADLNAIIFRMNIHDTKNTVTPDEIAELRRRPDIAGYFAKNADDLEQYIPVTVFLRIVRSLDYLKARPEWNGKTLVAAGPSFGGAQSIVSAALDPQVTLCLPGGAAMCDHLGHLNDQKEGWPHLLKRHEYKSDPARFEKVVRVSPYYDAANFARRIRCETVFSVGFIDTVCPPTSVYAAFNNVPSARKRMINAPTAGHGDSLRLGDPSGFGAPGDARLREVCREAGTADAP